MRARALSELVLSEEEQRAIAKAVGPIVGPHRHAVVYVITDGGQVGLVSTLSEPAVREFQKFLGELDDDEFEAQPTFRVTPDA